MSPDLKHAIWHDIWVQVPFVVWLIALWMLLWGQFTVLAFVTGLIVAVFVLRVFRLPTVDLGGRLNPWYSAVFLTRFLWAVMMGSLGVTVQVWNLRRQPGAAIMGVPLRYADDIIMTHVSVTASLIPGSLVIENDRERRIIYLHVIGADSTEDVDHMREEVLEWEKRIVRAVGSPAQYRALKADERRAREVASAGRRTS